VPFLVLINFNCYLLIQVHGAPRVEYAVADGTMAQLPSFQTCATDATKLNMNANNANGGTAKRLGFVSVV